MYMANEFLRVFFFLEMFINTMIIFVAGNFSCSLKQHNFNFIAMHTCGVKDLG